MNNFTDRDSLALITYIDSIPMFEELVTEEEAGAAVGTPPTFAADKRQSVAIGSQFNEFDTAVPAALREQIANVFLFAQLIADKKLETERLVEAAWWTAYLSALGQLGCRVVSSAESERSLSGTLVQVHKELAPLIAGLLAAPVGAAATVVAVLNSLAKMDENRPWITLFDRRSKRGRVEQFQMSRTRMEGASARVDFIGFSLEARMSTTQFLFLKLSSSSATLRYNELTLEPNLTALDAGAAAIRTRIVGQVSNFILDAEI